MRSSLFVVVLCLSVGSSVVLATNRTENGNNTQNAANNATDKFITPCTTPNGDSAYCTEIRQCPLFLKAIEAQQSESYEFIRRSRCGPNNENPNEPRICCGKVLHFLSTSDASAAPPQLPSGQIPPRNHLPADLDAVCGEQPVVVASRIVGGTEAELGEFPWMVRMVHKNETGFRTFGCSGFLIHHRYVLTAAHCVLSDLIPLVGPISEVLVGEHNTKTDPDCETAYGETICAPPAQYVRVGKIYPHPKYDKYSLNRMHDIAVIPLKRDVEFNQYIQPICLPNDPIPEIRALWLSGWGLTEANELSTIKRKVTVPVTDIDACSRVYMQQSVELTSLRHICAGTEQKDSCAGDSGGPAMYHDGKKWFGVGVVSFGVGCGRKGWPGVYTNVTSYVGWIKGKVAVREARLRRRVLVLEDF